ncbi:MAG: nucleotide exchange factor GrpE [Candidatus Omnitrophica bacterium]|nr:nucleotide exchange factor GrpE [Candidatus Omnitrophota bacterium]
MGHPVNPEHPAPEQPALEVRVPPELAEKRQRAAAHDELERLKSEAAEAKDNYLRAVAEIDNTKKRLQREKDEFAKYAAESVIRGLLPIVDSLDQALVAVDKQSDPQAVIKGVHLIYRQLLGVLEQEGVKRISTIGERFDPHLHEAAGHVPVADGAVDGTIQEEVHVGYTMHGKVIRPALVKIAKATHDTRPTTYDQDQGGIDNG